MTESNVARYYFEDIDKQAHATRFGMWVFLTSEVLFFTALFGLYWTNRAHYPATFDIGVSHNELWIGTTNTAILLTSSYLVALAVAMQRKAKSRTAALLFWGAAILGVIFLALKGLEYYHHIKEGAVPGGGTAFYEGKPSALPVFFSLYFAMTGLHALHVTAGILLLVLVGGLGWSGRFKPPFDYVVDNTGLYWHLVDVIWIFLWPMFYLMREAP